MKLLVLHSLTKNIFFRWPITPSRITVIEISLWNRKCFFSEFVVVRHIFTQSLIHGCDFFYFLAFNKTKYFSWLLNIFYKTVFTFNLIYIHKKIIFVSYCRQLFFFPICPSFCLYICLSCFLYLFVCQIYLPVYLFPY